MPHHVGAAEGFLADLRTATDRVIADAKVGTCRCIYRIAPHPHTEMTAQAPQ
jgi:hypothetical protein